LPKSAPYINPLTYLLTYLLTMQNVTSIGVTAADISVSLSHSRRYNMTKRILALHVSYNNLPKYYT